MALSGTRPKAGASAWCACSCTGAANIIGAASVVVGAASASTVMVEKCIFGLC